MLQFRYLTRTNIAILHYDNYNIYTYYIHIYYIHILQTQILQSDERNPYKHNLLKTHV